MIDSIKLQFGAHTSSPPLELAILPVTVFVGPNNSGKSKVLVEIYDWCTTGDSEKSNHCILAGGKFSEIPVDNISALVQSMILKPRSNDSLGKGYLLIGKDGRQDQVKPEQFEEAISSPNAKSSYYCHWYLRYHTLKLDGHDRIESVSKHAKYDLQEHTQNYLDILFRDNLKRQEIRRITFEAFGMYFVIDPTSLGKLRVRFSKEAPNSEIQERGIHDEAVQFHKNAIDIADLSDGIKAFTGIVAQIVAGDPRIVLIDEPEAFLHPALAFKLGKEVAISAASSGKTLFVSTHSSNFVMGCIQSGAPLNIVRLTYQGGVPTARTLPNEKILKLMRNPLLRSTGVLEGLFYESVVVAESDSDRAFYQEINERMLRRFPDKGIPNCLFLNAQNKQTIHQIVRPLRELGIPAAGVVDVDILKDGGKTWKDFLSGGFVPEVSHEGLGQTRSAIRQKCEQSGRDMKRDGGIHTLGQSDREAAESLFDQLANYGLFVVQNGELESWLKHLGANGHGPAWLIDIFQKMGEDPDSAAYVKPGFDDVWAFIERIGKWLKKSDRKGTGPLPAPEVAASSG